MATSVIDTVNATAAAAAVTASATRTAASALSSATKTAAALTWFASSDCGRRVFLTMAGLTSPHHQSRRLQSRLHELPSRRVGSDLEVGRGSKRMARDGFSRLLGGLRLSTFGDRRAAAAVRRAAARTASEAATRSFDACSAWARTAGNITASATRPAAMRS